MSKTKIQELWHLCDVGPDYSSNSEIDIENLSNNIILLFC